MQLARNYGLNIPPPYITREGSKELIKNGPLLCSLCALKMTTEKNRRRGEASWKSQKQQMIRHVKNNLPIMGWPTF
jgi:hypothetical protein